jgi:hypothetical protein
MSKKLYKIRLYYSTYCEFSGVEADSEGDAILETRKKTKELKLGLSQAVIRDAELLMNMQEWHEADEAELCGDEE